MDTLLLILCIIASALLIVIGIAFLKKANEFDRKYRTTDNCASLQTASNCVLAGEAAIIVGIILFGYFFYLLAG